jgi:translation initiation factor 6
MKIEMGTLKSSPFVGVFSVVTDKIALFPQVLEAKEKKQVEKLFGLETIYTSLANSSLIGVVAIGNSHGFAVSEIVEQEEIDALEESGIRIKKVSGITALGNMVECNDEKAFCSKAVPKKTIKEIEKALKVECIEAKVAESDLIGSNIVLTNKGFIANPMISEEEFNKIEKETGLEGATATANFGDKFVGNGVIANSNAAFVGLRTSGHELIRIDEGLS